MNDVNASANTARAISKYFELNQGVIGVLSHQLKWHQNTIYVECSDQLVITISVKLE